MNGHLVLWILLMQVNISINKGTHRHCYQVDNSRKGNRTKVRVARSIFPYDEGYFNLPENDVCSTWGNFNYRTFDGVIYSFPGLCNYLFASHCGKQFEDFNIQIQQSLVVGLPTISQISMRVNGLLLEIINLQPIIQGAILELPYSRSGVLIEKLGSDVKVSVKLILVLVWHEDKSVHLSLNKKYRGETCGLCANFDGDQDNDFQWNGWILTPLKFGNVLKMRKPGQTCIDPTPETGQACVAYKDLAFNTLTSSKWERCNDLVDVSPYIEAFMRDMCVCKLNTRYNQFCLCNTISEYSRQCAFARGNPPEWRTPKLCLKKCPLNLVYKECNSPCVPTCSNPGIQYFCEGTCVAGCFCPTGLVKDDITNTGCVRIEKCPCTYNNEIYLPGSFHNASCETCLCSGGHWNCEDLPCPSTCSMEGGSHVTTFDETHFTFHGRCFYVLARSCASNDYLITVEMQKCAYSETATCLTRVILFLDNGKNVFEIQYDSNDFPFAAYDATVMAEAGVLIFWPSSFYMVVHTQKGLYLEVQLTPIMQLYVMLDPSHKGKTCGLCGNFNDIQRDDFQGSSGGFEVNAAEFANTWKTQHFCTNIQTVPEHPCIYGMEIEKYAHYWCNMLIDEEGPFSACHASVNPDLYLQNCLYDTCSCKRAEDCLCAALSSYAWVCAVAGAPLNGWREEVCRNYISFCPPSFIFSYKVTTCIPTCRSLSEPDPACSVKFLPVDGCVCPPKTYLNEKGSCVRKEQCSCYFKGVPVSSDKPLLVGREICSCINGKINCTLREIPECLPPMTFFDCEKARPNAKGSECPHSCQTSKSQCYSPLCVSGCLCPEGLLLNDSGKCVTEEQCPCVHNGITYQPGDTVMFHCDQCVCRNRTWLCDSRSDMGFCTVYGEGHCTTFDSKRYTIRGDCEHILVEDYCDIDDLSKGTFRVITENIPCGTTGTSCSKAIVAYLGAHKLILTDGYLEVIKRASEVDIPYKVRNMGNFLVIEAMNGLVIIWDRMTSIFIHLSKVFKGKVCGLCGNFDGNSNNDFTTRSQYVVGDAREFTDSWKLAPECPDVFITKDPCVVNPYRVPWAQKYCSVIMSDVFAACHAEVDPEKYVEACVSDTCACDMGGDCDCLCTAIAAYAQACSDACVCIDWRTPTICPLFCDFYNKEGECQWHYRPCGAPCLKTCRNPSGKCLFHLKGLEGCYPECLENKPFFNEHEMICVSQCGCFDDDDNYYQIGAKIKSCNSCEDCVCTAQGIVCKYDINACFCEYKGHVMDVGEIIQTEDKFQNCIIVTCGLNGTVVSLCYPTLNSTIETRTATTSLYSKSTYETKLPLGTTIPSTKPFRSSSIFSSTSTSVTTGLSRASTSSLSTKSTKVSSAQTQTFTTTESISSRVAPTPSSSTVTSRSLEVSHLSTFRPNTTTGPLKTSTQSVVSSVTSTLSLGVTETPTKVSVKSTETTTAKKETLGSRSTQVKQDVEKTTAKDRISTYYKCINVTCLDNGELDVIVLPCPEVKNITCDNGKMPTKIYDHDGCCYHYECPGCMGTGGIRRRPGEKWVENCQTCTCDNDLLKIFCSPFKCTKLDPHVCDKPWLKPLIVVTEPDICCPRIECGCIPANCNNLAPNCPLGYIAFPIIDNDGCCITFECRAMDVCVHEGAVYEVGKFIWTEKSSCKTCQCTNKKDTLSGLNVVSCETVTCNETCSEGFAYEKSEIDCCGSCEQVSCVVEISDGSHYFMQPGESQFYGDLCTLYTCTAMNGRFVTSSQKTFCPELNEEECESGIIIKTPDGCCDVCKGFELCTVHEKISLISNVGCEANVTLTYCEGSCSSFRKFSTNELAMDGVCSCCHELETTQEVIELACPSGKHIPFALTYVQKCGCVSKECTP